MAEIDYITAQIASGQSLSPEVDIGSGKSLVGILVPSNWTTASLSFQASIDGVNWAELEDVTANPISVASLTGGTGYYIGMAPAQWRGVQAIKVRSGTKAAPVNQANTVNLTLVTRLVRGFP